MMENPWSSMHRDGKPGPGQGSVLVERLGRVARVILNQPERRNPLSTKVGLELIGVLRAADEDDEVGAVILTGRGAAFSGGADLAEFRASIDAMSPAHWESGAIWNELYALFPAMAKPVVAAVNGPAMAGGCGLVASCDFAIASDQARFGTPEVNIGLAPLFILPALIRAVGRRHALELTLSGRTIDAQEAVRIGLVNEVVPHDRLEAASTALAEELASKGPFTMRLAKHAFQRIAELDYQSGLAFARAIRGTFLESPELRAGIDRFFAGKAE